MNPVISPHFPRFACRVVRAYNYMFLVNRDESDTWHHLYVSSAQMPEDRLVALIGYMDCTFDS